LQGRSLQSSFSCLLENGSHFAKEQNMKLSRRGFLVSASAAATMRAVPVVTRAPGRRILTLVYDKGLGMMRAVERVVP
jgi:hypothetical protein